MLQLAHACHPTAATAYLHSTKAIACYHNCTAASLHSLGLALGRLESKTCLFSEDQLSTRHVSTKWVQPSPDSPFRFPVR